jgi:hypothetical protein
VTLKFLTSFHYFRNFDYDALVEEAGDEPMMIFADSGAFSALSLGAEVTIEDYAEWLLRWKHHFSVYASLDVIGDHVGTMSNQRRLEQEFGLNPIPVFHVGSDLKDLEALCEEYPYIAFGGMVSFSKHNLGPWLLKCFRITEKHGTRVHGFGQTRHAYLMDFPFFSVDSSSWVAGQKFGSQRLWDPQRSKFVTVNVGDRSSCYKHGELIRSYGFDPSDISESEKWSRHVSIPLSLQTFTLYEAFLRKRWSAQRPVDEGLNIYLAVVREQPGLFIEAAQRFHYFLAVDKVDVPFFLNRTGDPS